MEIVDYEDRYHDEVIALVLGIQNDEAGIGLGLDEQPDLADVPSHYLRPGGGFWLAVDEGRVVGTIGLLPKTADGAVLKKFFVDASVRGTGIGSRLYERLLAQAHVCGTRWLVLDTPSVATASHRFYERAGFERVEADALPFPYDFPDRDSLIYVLEL